jgi:hypothetical protein
VKINQTKNQPCVFEDNLVHELLLKYDLRAKHADGMPGVFNIVHDAGFIVAKFPSTIREPLAAAYIFGFIAGFNECDEQRPKCELEKAVRKNKAAK